MSQVQRFVTTPEMGFKVKQFNLKRSSIGGNRGT